jgi:hypothetical protein
MHLLFLWPACRFWFSPGHIAGWRTDGGDR